MSWAHCFIDATGGAVGPLVDPRGDVELVAVGLTSETLPSRPQAFELAAQAREQDAAGARRASSKRARQA